MALQFQMVGPGFPSPAGNGMADPFEVNGSERPDAVHGVFGMGFAGRNRRKRTDGVPYGGGGFFGEVRKRKFGIAQPGRHEHEPFPGLGNSIIRTVYDVVADGVPEGNELLLKSLVGFVFGRSRHVFHGHELGSQFVNQAGEMKKESPLLGSSDVPAVGIGRERLAGGAAREKPDGTFGIAFRKFGSGNLGDVGFDEFGSAVGFEGVPASGIHVDAGLDGNAGLQESTSESSGSAEEVDRLYVRFFRHGGNIREKVKETSPGRPGERGCAESEKVIECRGWIVKKPTFAEIFSSSTVGKAGNQDSETGPEILPDSDSQAGKRPKYQ